jgi:multicomponent Na+:H+ antiporter subunit F
MVETLQNYVLVGALIFLSICLVFSFIRSLIGPRVADRIVAVNMIGTQVILIICILAIYFKEGGLVDVALIYAMFSFLAVVLFSRIYIGVYNEKEYKKGEGQND